MEQWTWDTPFGNVQLKMGYDHHNGHRDYLSYILIEGDKIVFRGTDFSPSPLLAWDSEDSVMALLSFLTLQPGDTDEGYFADYTEEQLEWCMGETAEELRCLVMDLECAKEEAR